MKTGKSVLFLGLIALCAASVFAQTGTDFNVELTDDGAGVVITRYTGKAAAVTIPATIQGKPVREIGSGAFEDSGITSVVIPRGVTQIGWWAFNGCGKLAQVTLPDGLTTIGNGAFADCTALRNVVLPDSVTFLGGRRYSGDFDPIAGPPEYEDSAFSGSGLTSITLSRNLTDIPNLTFFNCKHLTSIVIPEGVTSIGQGAFLGCSALTSITLPSTIETIGSGAFADCSALSQVFIPGEVSSIEFWGGGQFEGCSKLSPAAQAALRKLGYAGGFQRNGADIKTARESIQ